MFQAQLSCVAPGAASVSQQDIQIAGDDDQTAKTIHPGSRIFWPTPRRAGKFDSHFADIQKDLGYLSQES